MDITTLLVAIIGGGTIGVIFKTVFDRICKKNDRKDEYKKEFLMLKRELRNIEKEIVESQRDRKRQQLLTLMYHDPKNVDTILAIGKKYFVDLKGNWYMDSQFTKWMKGQDVEPPSWFKTK